MKPIKVPGTEPFGYSYDRSYRFIFYMLENAITMIRRKYPSERARFKDGKVYIDKEYDYVWDGCFRYLKENNYSGWTEQELREAADIAYEGHSRLELGLED